MGGKDGQELMKRFIESLKNKEWVQMIGWGAVTFLAVGVLCFYFLNADISKAPTFIYSQF